MAGDPEAIPILLGLELDEFSMAPASIPHAKQVIRKWSLSDARQLTQLVLELDSAQSVEKKFVNRSRMTGELKNLGVLWDLDSTLVDTGEFHFQAWKQIFSEYSIPFYRESQQATFGMNAIGIVTAHKGILPPLDFLAEKIDRKEALFRQLTHRVS